MKKKFYWRMKDGKYIKVRNKSARSGAVKYQIKVAREILKTNEFWNQMAIEDKESI